MSSINIRRGKCQYTREVLKFPGYSLMCSDYADLYGGDRYEFVGDIPVWLMSKRIIDGENYLMLPIFKTATEAINYHNTQKQQS